MSCRVGLVALAVVTLGCGGLASSRDGEREGIALPDAGLAPPVPPAERAPSSTTPDAGLGNAEPLDSLCGADGVLRSSAEVSTQEQADALAGCTRIAGDLTLHHRGVDLSPLGSLRVIEGRLWVDGEDAPRRGTSREGLDGFRSLEQVGGLVLLHASLTDLKPLARLRRIGLDPLEPREFEPTSPGVFEIRNCDGFVSLEGLDSLEQVTELNLSNNSELRSLAGMPRLARVEQLQVLRCPLVDLGGVGPAVQDLSLTFTALTELTGLGDARQLSRLKLRGNQALTSLEGGTFPAQMSSLSSTDDALVSLKGLENLNTVEELTLSAPALETLSGLEGLVQVGSLQLKGQTRLASLAALRSLVRAQRFEISDDAALPNLVGLSNLREVETFNLHATALTELRGLGSLTVGYLELVGLAVTSLAGLEQVTPSVLNINQTPRLTTLDGLDPFALLTDLSVNDAPLLADLRALSGLTQLGSLNLTNTAVANLDALSGLVQLTSLNLQGNSQLSQLNGVSRVSGLNALGLYDNAALRTLPRLENVTGTACESCFGPFTLGIVNNPLLQSGPGLPRLEQAGGFLITGNTALTTLGDAPVLRSVGILSVEDNPSLARVQLPALGSAREIYVRRNTALDDTPLAGWRQMPEAEHVKIVSNRSGPARLSPCPWPGDGQCDELSSDCAPGTDRSDCMGL